MNPLQQEILATRARMTAALASPYLYTRAECHNGHQDTYPPGEFQWGSSFCYVCSHSMHPIALVDPEGEDHAIST